MIESSARTSAVVGSLVATIAVIALVGTVTAFAFASKHEPRAGLARLVSSCRGRSLRSPART